MILADTSAWIELLRSTGSAANTRMRALLGTEDLCFTEPVALELLAGLRPDELQPVRATLYGHMALPVTTEDWEEGAAVYRACRSQGTTPRKVIDCLIAAVAIRHGAALLHHDRDFEAIARHAPLQLVDL